MYFKGSNTTEEKINLANKRIGKNLRYLRNANKDKQEDIAKMFKMNKSSVCRYETGETPIAASNLAVLSDKYKVDINYFINEPGTEPYHTDIIIKCLGKLLINNDDIDNACMYMSDVVKNTYSKIGYSKLFDMIYVLLKFAGNDIADASDLGYILDMIKSRENSDSSVFLNKIIDISKGKDSLRDISWLW